MQVSRKNITFNKILAAVFVAGFFVIFASSPLLAFAKTKIKKSTTEQDHRIPRSSNNAGNPIALASDNGGFTAPDQQQNSNTGQNTPSADPPPTSIGDPGLQITLQPPVSGGPATTVAQTTSDSPTPTDAVQQAPTTDPSTNTSVTQPASSNNPTQTSQVQPAPVAQPPAPTKIAFTAQSDPSLISAEQAQQTISTLSQNIQQELWNPESSSGSSVYATDAFSPELTRVLTVSAFLLIFFGLAIRRTAPQRQIETNFGLEQQKLSFVK